MTPQHFVVKDGMIHAPLTGGDGMTAPLELADVCVVMNRLARNLTTPARVPASTEAVEADIAGIVEQLSLEAAHSRKMPGRMAAAIFMESAVAAIMRLSKENMKLRASYSIDRPVPPSVGGK
jgi:hypothetical protein